MSNTVDDYYDYSEEEMYDDYEFLDDFSPDDMNEDMRLWFKDIPFSVLNLKFGLTVAVSLWLYSHLPLKHGYAGIAITVGIIIGIIKAIFFFICAIMLLLSFFESVSGSKKRRR